MIFYIMLPINIIFLQNNNYLCLGKNLYYIFLKRFYPKPSKPKSTSAPPSKYDQLIIWCQISAPIGIRTRVTSSKGWNDWPDYTMGADLLSSPVQIRTGVAGSKGQNVNHYTTGPIYIYMQWGGLQLQYLLFWI